MNIMVKRYAFAARIFLHFAKKTGGFSFFEKTTLLSIKKLTKFFKNEKFG